MWVAIRLSLPKAEVDGGQSICPQEECCEGCCEWGVDGSSVWPYQSLTLRLWNLCVPTSLFFQLWLNRLLWFFVCFDLFCFNEEAILNSVFWIMNIEILFA